VTPVKKSLNASFMDEDRMGSGFKTAEKSYNSSADKNSSANKSYRQIKTEDETVKVLREYVALEK
jgi:hypothetical protein